MKRWGVTVLLIVLAITAAHAATALAMGCTELPRGARVALSFFVTILVLALRGDNTKEIQ